MTRPIPEEVAASYNEHARRDPSAQRWLEVLEAQGRLCHPLRRSRRSEA